MSIREFGQACGNLGTKIHTMVWRPMLDLKPKVSTFYVPTTFVIASLVTLPITAPLHTIDWFCEAITTD